MKRCLQENTEYAIVNGLKMRVYVSDIAGRKPPRYNTPNLNLEIWVDVMRRRFTTRNVQTGIDSAHAGKTRPLAVFSPADAPAVGITSLACRMVTASSQIGE